MMIGLRSHKRPVTLPEGVPWALTFPLKAEIVVIVVGHLPRTSFHPSLPRATPMRQQRLTAALSQGPNSCEPALEFKPLCSN